ncbi:MAG: hypothetical protein JNL18_10285 [Planctomycetaceae bacterium]|nr:hypothetical protein [Planctomycetaceae bacterium]
MMQRFALATLLLAYPALSHAARFVPLGFLAGGNFSEGKDVSADGSIVVGFSTSTIGGEAFRWTEAGGMVGLGFLSPAAPDSDGWGISADGSIIVGESGGKAFKWTQSDGMTSLGAGRAVAASNDGSKIVGFGDVTNGHAVTPDGAVWVGASNFGSGQEAFRATSGGVQPLGDVPGFDFASVALGITPDGSVIVGQSNAFLDPDGRGFPVETTVAIRWTESEGMVPIGDLPGGGHGSTATDVSADGSVIVGWGVSAIDSEAYRWMAATGVRSIRELLLAEGIDTLAMGWTLGQANGVSADGRIIVGTGVGPGSTNPQAWLVELPVPEPSSGALCLVLAALALGSRKCRRRA